MVTLLLKMDTIIIEDMMSYMQALGKFKKGDTIVVKVLRNKKK